MNVISLPALTSRPTLAKYRPREHEIDQRACILFDNALPDNWVSRPLSSDYGVDKEIEIFKDGKSTGVIFKVQIKGTETPHFISEGSILSHSMSIRDIDYLCYELKIPAILAIVDVLKEVIWWHAIQVDNGLMVRLDQARGNAQESIAIHINRANILPNTSAFLFDKVLESGAILAVRTLSSTAPNTFLNSASSIPDIDAVLADFGRNAILFRSIQRARLWKIKDYAEVERQSESVLASESCTVEEKFEACLYLNKLALIEARAERNTRHYGEIDYSFAQKLMAISKRGPLHLRSFALLSLLSAELHLNAFNDLYLFMNYEVNKASVRTGDEEPLWILILPSERNKAAYQVIHKYRQCHKVLRFMLEKKFFALIPLGIDLVIASMITFLFRLRKEGMEEAATLYEQSLRQMGETAIDISLRMRDWEGVSFLMLNASLLCNFGNEQSRTFYRAWGIDKISRIEDPVIKDSALEQLNAQFYKMGQYSLESAEEEEIDDLEVDRQIYVGMATSMGIDLNDESDEIANIVNTGIKDLDPTRILKNCRHLYVLLGSRGMLARMLKLPTAGSKFLFCTLHGYGMGSLSLDDLYESFKRDYCASCKNQDPHPEDWRWTRSWQHEQYRQYKDKFKAT